MKPEILERVRSLRVENPAAYAAVLGVAAVLIATVGGAGAFKAYEAVEGPEACTTCHTMQPYYAQWLNSTHGQHDVTCMECHGRDGVTGWVEMRMSEAGQLATYVADPEKRTGPLHGVYEGSAPLENCRDCHDDLEEHEEGH